MFAPPAGGPFLVDAVSSSFFFFFSSLLWAGATVSRHNVMPRTAPPSPKKKFPDQLSGATLLSDELDISSHLHSPNTESKGEPSR